MKINTTRSTRPGRQLLRTLAVAAAATGIVSATAGVAAAETDNFGYSNYSVGSAWVGATDVRVTWQSGGYVSWSGRVVDTNPGYGCVSVWRKYDIAWGPDSSWSRLASACGNGGVGTVAKQELFYDTNGAWLKFCPSSAESGCAAPVYKQDNS
jgi:hypothetical protein